jgi:hypothetical protein
VLDDRRHSCARRSLGFLAMLVLAFAPFDSAFAARARATSGQWIWGQSGFDMSANETRCYALSGGSTIEGSPTVGRRSAPWIAGRFSVLSFRIHVDTAHDIGDASHYATGTLYLNGQPSALSGTIRGGPSHDREAPVDLDAVTVEDGDLVEFCLATGPRVPTRSHQYHWSIYFEPETPNQFVYATVATFGGASAQHVEALGTNAVVGNPPEVATQFLVPVAGTMTRALCAQADTQAAGSRTWTLRRNGADSALACAIRTGRAAESERPVRIAAGDLLGLRMTADSPSPSSSVVGVTWVWVPDSPGIWWLASSGNAGWSGGAPSFQKLLGPQPASSTLYSANATPFASNAPSIPYVTVLGLHAAVDAAPGSGSWRVDLVEYPTQNSAGAPLTSRGGCAITGSAMGCSAALLETARVNALGPSWYELRVTPTGAPRAARGKPAIALRTLD